jgi:hypothetical protein
LNPSRLAPPNIASTALAKIATPFNAFKTASPQLCQTAAPPPASETSTKAYLTRRTPELV